MKEIALLIVSVFSLLGFSQNAILGVVFNEQGIPLPGVQVTASPADKETYTDADGFFSFQVLAAQTLTFSLDGYETFKLVAVVDDEITPLSVRFSEIDKTHVGLFVAVENVRFTDAEQGKPFVDPRDYYDTQRSMEACEGAAKTSLLLETSAFVLYKDVPLPSGTGTIRGIVSKSFNGSNFVLMLNDASDAPLTGVGCGG